MLKACDAFLSLSLNPSSCSLLGWLSLGEPSSINFTKASWWDAGLSPVPLHKVSHFPSLSRPETFSQHPPLLTAVIQLSQIRSWTSKQTMPVCNPPASIILLSFFKKNLWHFPDYTPPVYPLLRGLGFDVLCHCFPTIQACLLSFLWCIQQLCSITIFIFFSKSLYIYSFFPVVSETLG